MEELHCGTPPKTDPHTRPRGDHVPHHGLRLTTDLEMTLLGGGREGKREGEREGGKREGGREGGRRGRREGGRGREGGRERGRE